MNKKLILLLPIIAGICWGSGGIFVRLLNMFGFNSVTILSTRVIGATLILFIGLLLFDRESFKIKLKDIWIFIGSGVIGVMMLNLCYNEAAFHVTLSLAALLLSLAPIFAMFFSAVLFNEKITSKKIGCLILAMIGCILVTGLLEGSSPNWSPYGIAFGLMSALFWALYGVFSRITTNKGYSIYTTIFYSFLFISIVLAPFTEWGMFGSFLIVNPVEHGLIALLHSIFTSILPYLLFTVSLLYIENGKATILTSGSEPVSAAIFGFVLFGEVLSFLNIIGIIITIIAISILIKINENENES